MTTDKKFDVIKDTKCNVILTALFVFLIDDAKQNAGSQLTPVFYAMVSHGTLGFTSYGSFNNHLIISKNLIGC